MPRLERFRETCEKDAVLAEATSRLRDSLGAGESLSAESWERILSLAAATPARFEKALKPLFVPAFRLAVAACAPVVVAAAVGAVVFLNRSGSGEGAAALRAQKVGDQVVFTIANGKSVHYVYRSTDPGRFDPSSAVRVEGGQFAERATNSPGIVFYRIE